MPLVLTRRLGESLKIGDNIKITIIKIDHSQAKLSIEAPREITVLRTELDGVST